MMIYKCLNCNHEVIPTLSQSKVLDGKRCEKCNGPVVPINLPKNKTCIHCDDEDYCHEADGYIDSTYDICDNCACYCPNEDLEAVL